MHKLGKFNEIYLSFDRFFFYLDICKKCNQKCTAKFLLTHSLNYPNSLVFYDSQNKVIRMKLIIFGFKEFREK